MRLLIALVVLTALMGMSVMSVMQRAFGLVRLPL